ncbi:MAG: 3-hydroxyacyl-CoA dehydrogenase NAD-binding domain-containing protein, partial [Nitrobacter sp.]
MTSRDKVAALGAGRMGRGIAIAFAFAGHDVALVDFKPRANDAFAKLAADALGDIETTLRMLARV